MFYLRIGMASAARSGRSLSPRTDQEVRQRSSTRSRFSDEAAGRASLFAACGVRWHVASVCMKLLVATPAPGGRGARARRDGRGVGTSRVFANCAGQAVLEAIPSAMPAEVGIAATSDKRRMGILSGPQYRHQPARANWCSRSSPVPSCASVRRIKA